ncbi:MAG: TrkH family potassium uptake protein [Chromatiales bacterium]|nr:TrkH family potassium uptake protein [Chromatiales bacterium]
MRPRHAIRLVGLFLLLFSITLIPPTLIAAYLHDGQVSTFTDSILLLTTLGLLLWYPTRSCRGNLLNRETFVVVALFWILLSTLGSLPLYLGAHLDLTDAVFEAVSGFTATGATTLASVDALPKSIVMYRQQLQWYGGLGIIVLAVAILPMLGVGGMQLYRAEIAGPMKDERITSRVTQTARFMLIIYVFLTIACASAYWLAGMTLFDAVGHSFATVSTGGFSTHDDGIASFDNPAIDIVAIVFMLMGAISFNTHFLAVHRFGPAIYWRDTQTRVFFSIVALLIAITAGLLWISHSYGPVEALRHGAFEAVSVITGTGFSGAFATWPLGLPLILMFASFIGGCAGSTTGGLKVIRLIVLSKVGLREMQRLIHPHMVRPIRLGERALPGRVLDAVWSFFSVYVVTFTLLILAVMATGVDHVTAFGAVAASLNNVGPGLGEVATTFHDVNDGAKWLCTLAMLLGRLEIFTLLVLLTPAFWRK